MLVPPAELPQLEELGVKGRRACILVYLDDRAKPVEAALRELQRSAEDYARRGCTLVAVRQDVAPDTPADHPRIRFVNGLAELAELRAALGLEASLAPVKFYPRAYLIDPDGRVLAVGDDVRASGTVMAITRALHAATIDATEAVAEEEVPFAEDQARRQRAYKESRDWEAVLEDNEELRQPARPWWDGLGDGPSGNVLTASKQAMLPEAGAPRLASPEGVQAPEWYALAKQKADADAADEARADARRRASAVRSPTIKEWVDGGFGLAGPPPGAPRAATPPRPARAPAPPPSEPASGSDGGIRAAKIASLAATLRELEASGAASPAALRPLQQELAKLQAAQGDGGGAGGGDAAAPSEGEAERDGAAAAAGVESVLERAGLLAQGLARSAPTSESRRRLRLLRELEAAIAELEAAGITDEAVLGPLRGQVEAAWGSAPPAARAEAQAAAAAAEREGRPLSAKRLAEIFGDATPTPVVEFDPAKWRLSFKWKGRK